uniref:Transposable element protein, putative n=2 Tax=Oryza sativa subsp. japonica TaxID=39947 RepID=Q2R994_ORYSJ|nr:Transposable element protein, putative [Oryza sativa Japonica Group]ABA91904.1 hypothetical protein LOC_Os11g09540 [Oryza sativa Japonica Group]
MPRGNAKTGKGNSKPNNDSGNKTACFKCGCYNHIAKKCRTPKHLVEHFTLETGATDPIPEGSGPSKTKTLPSEEECSLDIDNMLVEYASNDIYGDLN